MIALLVSAVIMTIGLSISKKTVVNTKVETSQEQLKQAFNAAESGIDYYFGTGSTKFVAVDNRSTADISVKNIGGGSTVTFDQFVLSGKGLDFWLVSHDNSGNLDYSSYYNGGAISLCFSNPLTAGAIKVDYFYRAGGNYFVKRYGYNLLTDAVSGYSNFASPPGQGACIANYRQLNLSVPLAVAGEVPLLLATKNIDTGGRLYLLGTGQSFPVQGITVNSTGRVGDVSVGVVNRSLEVNKTYQVPAFALEAITAFGNVLSN